MLDVERVAVVGAEADARRGREREERRERVEIFGDAALADPHRDPVAELLLRLAELRALVARGDPGARIRRERLAAHERRVTVERAAVERRELVDHERVAVQDARHVHHLGEAERLRMIDERQEGGRVEDAAAVRLELGRGHTARHHHAEIEPGLQATRSVEEELDPGHAEHVRELVRIAHRRRRAARQHRALKALRHQERALEMHVRVDEARHDVRAFRVDRPFAGEALCRADDDAVRDREITFAERAAKHVEPAHVLEDEVARLVTLRRAQPSAEHIGERHAAQRSSL